MIAIALTLITAAAPAPAVSLEELRTAEIGEARRLTACLDSLWPGLGELAALTRVVLIAEDGTRIVSPGLAEGPDGDTAWARRRRRPTEEAIRQIDLAGQRVLLLDERVPDPVRSLLLTAAGSTSAGEASVAWVVSGLFVQWARGRLFEDPVPGLFRPGSPPPEDAAALQRALEIPQSQGLDDAIRDFLAIRRAWLAALPELPAAAFRRTETERGLALYAAYVALLTAQRGDYDPGPGMIETHPGFAYSLAPALREASVRGLRRAAAGDPQAGSAALSGFAIALLLDRAVDDWRRLLRSGEPALDGLLIGGR